jgi:hypothetical protein
LVCVVKKCFRTFPKHLPSRLKGMSNLIIPTESQGHKKSSSDKSEELELFESRKVTAISANVASVSSFQYSAEAKIPDGSSTNPQLAKWRLLRRHRAISLCLS